MNYHSFLFIIACLLQVSSSLSKFFKIIYTDYFCHIMLEKVLHILYNSQNDKSLFTFSCTKPTKDYKTTTNGWIVISSEDKSGWKRQTIHYWMWSRWRASTWVNNNLIKSRIPSFWQKHPHSTKHLKCFAGTFHQASASNFWRVYYLVTLNVYW